MEAAFGFGCIIGPSIGSLVYGAVGYEWTMYYFGIQTFLSMLVQWYFLPNSLNLDEEEGNEENKDKTSDQELELLTGYNKLAYGDIGLMTVLCDRMNTLAYFATFLGMFAMEFFVGYLSLHF